MAGMNKLAAQIILAAAAASHKGPPAFHLSDCAAATFDGYRALGLGDLGPADWTGRQAARAFRAAGENIGAAVSAVLGPFGWAPVEGDPVFLDLGLCKHGDAETLAIWQGLGWLARGPRGPVLMQTATASWRPPVARIREAFHGD